MRPELFNRPMTDRALNYTFLGALLSMFDNSPDQYLRQQSDLGIDREDEIFVVLPDATRVEAVFIKGEFSQLILLSGTTGTLHLAQLISGWQDTGGQVYSPGANKGLEQNSLNLLSVLPSGWLDPRTHLRIVGHSYGGAVGQIMMDYLVNVRGFEQVQCVSYGSPRPGNQLFQQRIERLDNTRWFCDDDPVRFIPPHMDEVPSVVAFQGARIVAGMNSQVQARTGYELLDGGQVLQHEGNPTRLHAVLTSIYNWCADNYGFRSVNHSVERYRHRLLQGLQAGFVIPPKDRSQPAEQPEPTRPRDIERFEKQAEADIAADPAINLRGGQTVEITMLRSTETDRYKRRKLGTKWGVMFKGDVVAIGPGKRRAGQIAKRLNRAARAGQ